ncbi:prephenate dehydrogenase [Aquimonas voraii]|uniref:Prephenate dehydrogenase n=1 Tax=Aquimonas voraii TaxID=265719 RepID=A0A1G6XY59_9GAMM|nr:prephenate dehydrogenase [Aquimonas voraii]SDD82633.1 prephenate dehydrogenase [Aquimonas voraii]
MRSTATVGIVGSAGAYGRWLARFFEAVMGCRVLGCDPADPAACSLAQLVAHSEVLVFSAPIAETQRLIDEARVLAGARAAVQLWIDVTSIKAVPVAAMLASPAEVLGLHPMTAPPKAPSLRGRVLISCEARIDRWRTFVDALYAGLEAERVECDPAQHDRVMALVQALVHAGHLAQAGVLAKLAADIGGPAALFPFRSASFELDLAMADRILAGNPAIYAGIQFDNPAVLPVLDSLAARVTRLRELVKEGDRDAFEREFVEAPRAAFGADEIARGNHGFEQVGYLLADLAHVGALCVHLPEDRPGSLRALLEVFEQSAVNLASIHSSRTPSGEVHFRFSFSRPPDPDTLARLCADIERDGIGRVLAPVAASAAASYDKSSTLARNPT